MGWLLEANRNKHQCRRGFTKDSDLREHDHHWNLLASDNFNNQVMMRTCMNETIKLNRKVKKKKQSRK